MFLKRTGFRQIVTKQVVPTGHTDFISQSVLTRQVVPISLVVRSVVLVTQVVPARQAVPIRETSHQTVCPHQTGCPHQTVSPDHPTVPIKQAAPIRQAHCRFTKQAGDAFLFGTALATNVSPADRITIFVSLLSLVHTQRRTRLAKPTTLNDCPKDVPP